MQKLGYKLLAILFLGFFACSDVLDESEALDANNEGIELMTAADYEGAITKLQEGLSYNNSSSETKVTIARNISLCYYEMSMMDSSIHYSKVSLSHSQKDSYPYYINKADIELLEGKTKEAMFSLKKARQLDSEQVEVNNTLGLIYLGDFSEDDIDYEKALHFNLKAHEVAQDRTTKEVLARNYYLLEQYDKALESYESLIKSFPTIEYYEFSRGVVLYDMGKESEGKAVLESLAQKDTSYIDSIQFLYEE